MVQTGVKQESDKPVMKYKEYTELPLGLAEIMEEVKTHPSVKEKERGILNERISKVIVEGDVSGYDIWVYNETGGETDTPIYFINYPIPRNGSKSIDHLSLNIVGAREAIIYHEIKRMPERPDFMDRVRKFYNELSKEMEKVQITPFEAKE